MSLPPVSVIVLAGGRSSRFGRDKLAEPIDGRPLLQHAIDAVRPVAAQIVVVAAPGATPPGLADVELIHDAASFEGPLAGVLAGLAAASEPLVVVVGGDMPTLVPAVIECLVVGLEPGVDVAVLEHDGRARPLPMALRRDAALAQTERSFRAGERRLRTLIEGLAVRVIPEPTWRALDPDGLTVRDIDTSADL
jgi:molybdenum cofactor guanylyltransferase